MSRTKFWFAALVCLITITTPARGEILGRSGKGYLERIDGCMVLHVEGDPYEMGYQHGQLLAEHCKQLVHYLFEVKAKEKKLEAFGQTIEPKQLVATIRHFQRPFIPDWFEEELNGLADGAGMDRHDVRIANGIPELFHCSGFALLPALTETGTILHGRVLDYSTDWRLQEHAVVIIAKPAGKIPFVNVSYAGFIGSVTGMNLEQVSIGEMGGRGLGKWAGVPMSVLVRRVLQEADSLEQAIAIFRDSRRTCEYYYVISDGETGNAIGMDGSADRFRTIKPGEHHELLPTPVDHAVLLSAGERYGHLCRLVGEIKRSQQKFSVERALRLMDAPVAMKSNLHNVLFAPAEGKFWVANAGADGQPAWTQPIHAYDLRQLLHADRPVAASGN